MTILYYIFFARFVRKDYQRKSERKVKIIKQKNFYLKGSKSKELNAGDTAMVSE